jgi:hypothetical protein
MLNEHQRLQPSGQTAKKQKERQVMNNHSDELTKDLAQPVTRRQAFKTFGLGLAGMALARFGLNEAHASTNGQLDGDADPNV